ncbi:hypothetical protein BH10ACI2_BH10ACI2_20420 [soil metagenome]
MENSPRNLGRLVAVYAIAPVYVQRAVGIVVLSFMFFLSMMFAFYAFQTVVYFLLASAFLVLYLVTMFSWVMLRKSVVEVYDNGFKYKKRSVFWNEIARIDAKTVRVEKGKPVVIPTTIQDVDKLMTLIRQRSDAK